MFGPINKNNGFTLIETLLVIAILAVIGSVTPVLSMDQVKSDSFVDEVDKVANLLQKTRLMAQNNIEQSKHGLIINPNMSSTYTIFKGNSYADSVKPENIDTEIDYPTLLDPSSPKEIVFEQLSGRTNNYGELIFVDPQTGKTLKIKINYEGQISW